MLSLLLLALPPLATAGKFDYNQSNAYGKPCVFEVSQSMMSDYELSKACPPLFYCFWDEIPFKPTIDPVTGALIKTKYTKAELDALAMNSMRSGASDYDPLGEGAKIAGVNGTADSVSQYGYCDCNKFYGFNEPMDKCMSPSAGTTFFQIWSIGLIVAWLWLFLATLYTIYGYQQSGQWKWCGNASCQTMLHMLWEIPVMIAFQAGYAVTTSLLDKQMVFHNSLLSYMFSIGMMGFGICALNIAVAWIEVVEKSQKKGQKGNTAMYKRVIYGSIFVYSFLILITLVVLGSTSMAGGVIMLGLVLAAVVYHFAGNKLGNMLASGAKKDDGDGPKEMTMDVMVKKTAKEISHLCAGVFVCCTLFIMTTNTNVWLSTPGIEGGMTLAWLLCVYVLRFIRFGGRRGMNKVKHLKNIFKCEYAKMGKLDNKGGSTTVESGVESEERQASPRAGQVAPAPVG